MRFLIHPFFDWIGLYIETGGETFIEKSKNIDIKSGFFIWSVGIQFEIDTIRTKEELVTLKNVIIKRNEKKRNIIIVDNNIIDVTEDQTLGNIMNEDDTKIKGDESVKFDENIRNLYEAKVGDVVVFNNILFYPNSETIREESFIFIDNIVKVLLDRKNIIVEIAGYTHSTGNQRAELELSMKRAFTVAEYLNCKGISFNRIKTTGYGGLTTAERADLNRRVEIKILEIK